MSNVHGFTGADVTHPTGFSLTEPSIAAVCGSTDYSATRYATSIFLQAHRVEIIYVRAPNCIIRSAQVEFLEVLQPG